MTTEVAAELEGQDTRLMRLQEQVCENVQPTLREPSGVLSASKVGP